MATRPKRHGSDSQLSPEPPSNKGEARRGSGETKPEPSATDAAGRHVREESDEGLDLDDRDEGRERGADADEPPCRPREKLTEAGPIKG